MIFSRKRHGKPARRASPAGSLRRKILPLVAGGLILLAGLFAGQGRVISVVDGDTLVVLTGPGTTERVRLYGVDTPELEQRGGPEATAFAEELLLFRKVSLTVMDRDRYDRTVAIVSLKDGRIANAELVREGHAWVYRDYCREALCESWLVLERQAKKQGLGLWRDGRPVEPWKWRRAHPRR